jgi:hypothetical protein
MLMSDIEETVEVPILEVDFTNFITICEKINLVDSVAIISMPNHVNEYASHEKTSVSDLMNILIEYQKEENKWRLKENKVVELAVGSDFIKVGEKTIYDSPRVVIVSKMNSAYVIPGERSLKEGGFQPNEIIKLSNLISSQLFLLHFVDVPKEDNNYDLRIEYSLINKNTKE